MYQITCHTMGGLGNQLFQIATTLATAWEYNLDPVFINKNPEGYTYAQRENYFGSVFRNLNIVPTLNLSGFLQHTEHSNHSFSKINNPNKNLLLRGYFQTSRYFNKYIDKLHDVLTIPDTDMENVSKYIDKLRETYKGKKLIGIHVRRTDYLKLNWDQPLSYYLSAMNNFDQENSVFVCFSDDIDWCKKNLPNIIPSENNKDYVDMFIFSQMDGYILSSSSFSWWGVFFGNKDKKKTVISPKSPWIRNNSYNQYIWEKDWIKI